VRRARIRDAQEHPELEAEAVHPLVGEALAEAQIALARDEQAEVDAIRIEMGEEPAHLSRPMSEIERYEPEPLVDEFAHPSQHTGLWGPNGAGKGVFAAWKIAARTRAGQNVLLLDYEGHEGE